MCKPRIGSRVRLILVAATFLILGWLLTSSLSPAQRTHYDKTYPAHSASDKHDSKSSHQAVPPKNPSIANALSDLHVAVADSISHLTPARRPVRVSDTKLVPERPSLGERVRIAKCTVIFGDAAVYERAVRTHEAHDRIHGYPLHVLRHGSVDDVWSRPAYILHLLLREMSKVADERLEWLFWVDADAVVLNPYVPIETFLPPTEFDWVNILVTKDASGFDDGVFPVRVCQWSVEFFSAVVSWKTYRPETNTQWKDQDVMTELLKLERFKKHALQIPQRWFNTYQRRRADASEPQSAERGDLLVHFSGSDDRDKEMLPWLDIAEQHLPEWELSLQHTIYPAETSLFWMNQKKLRQETEASLLRFKTKSNDLLERYGGSIESYAKAIIMGALKDYHEYSDKASEEKLNALSEKRNHLIKVAMKSDWKSDEVTEAIESVFVAREQVKATVAQPEGNNSSKDDENRGTTDEEGRDTKNEPAMDE